MSQLGKLIIRQMPMLQNYYLCACSSLHSLPFSHSLPRRFSSTTVRAASHSAAQPLSRRLRLPSEPTQPDLQSGVAEEEESELGAEPYKSRNELKLEARRAVRWGMDLASFSVTQIKRIISVASLEKEVFEALILVKKLGPDVREGKRRQFNYIGKLLREAKPELMDALIRATKDGDHSTLQSLSGSKTVIGENDRDYEENESDEEDEGPHIDIAVRWLSGLISKDMDITNEIYSIPDIDFDRQELRRLLRRVHSEQEKHKNADGEKKGEIEAAILNATKSLTRFLRSLAKQLPNES